MPDLIDAHHHFWDRGQPFNYAWLDAPAHAKIRGSYLPEHLEPHLKSTGVTRTVLVQTQHTLAENHWALSLAERHDFIAGVVGWVDLASSRVESQLLDFMAHPKAVGIRHITQDEPDDDFIVRPDVLRGLKLLERHGVPFDLLFYVKHLRNAATIARTLPDLPMVIDHLAKPRIKEHVTDDWLPHLRTAAAFPNVFCKLSGMVTEADHHAWKPADLKPYVQSALELFGPTRCMFGSDWPVCELAASYEQVVAALKEALGPITPSEAAEIFAGTARRFYRLPA